MRTQDILTDQKLPIPGKNQRLTARLLDIADITIKKRSDGTEYPGLKLKTNLLPGYNKSGIYVWQHPVFGIIYVGLNAAGRKGLNQRAEVHVRKLLNRLYKPTERTTAWEKFSAMFVKHSKEDINLWKEDLHDIVITYIPLADILDYEKQGLTKDDMKRDIKDIETRMIRKLNPYNNDEYHLAKNAGRKSSTRLPSN
jgi:hypothetical protein